MRILFFYRSLKFVGIIAYKLLKFYLRKRKKAMKSRMVIRKFGIKNVVCSGKLFKKLTKERESSASLSLRL